MENKHNRKIMNKYMIKESFSHLGKKYLELFMDNKEANTSINSNLNDLKNNKIAPKYKITTNQKLNKMISKLEQEKIKEKFFADSIQTKEYNIFHQKFRDLILKKNEKKIKFVDKRNKLDGIKQSIQRMKNWDKTHSLDENELNKKLAQNHRIPDLYRYSPKHGYVDKHIFVADLRGFFQENNEEEKSKPIINVNLNKSKNYRKINYKEFRKFFPKIPKVNNLSIVKKRNITKYNTRLSSSSVIKEVSEKKGKNSRPSSQLMKKDLYYNKLYSNSYVPNFKKMTSRNNSYISSDTNTKNMAEYLPDNDTISSNNQKILDFNFNLIRKKLKLRKIISTSNPPSQYLLLPILNNIK